MTSNASALVPYNPLCQKEQLNSPRHQFKPKNHEM